MRKSRKEKIEKTIVLYLQPEVESKLKRYLEDDTFGNLRLVCNISKRPIVAFDGGIKLKYRRVVRDFEVEDECYAKEICTNQLLTDIDFDNWIDHKAVLECLTIFSDGLQRVSLRDLPPIYDDATYTKLESVTMTSKMFERFAEEYIPTIFTEDKPRKSRKQLTGKRGN